MCVKRVWQIWVHFLFSFPSHRRPWEKNPEGKEREIDERLSSSSSFWVQRRRRPSSKEGGGVRTREALYYAGKEEEEAAANFEKTPPPPGGSEESSKHCQTWPSKKAGIYWTRGKTVNFSTFDIYFWETIKLKQWGFRISHIQSVGVFFIWNR